MAARPSWQGHLKLSLVTCPVAMYNAVSPGGDVHFNLINPQTGNRIRMITIDGGTEERVERRDLVKGFEIAKGEYVVVTPEEIDSVRLESTKTIDIDTFVPESEIDRLYWDNPYFLVPDGKLAAEPFGVIREAMKRSGRIALGRIVMSQRERVVALEAKDDGIVATTLRTSEEVRSRDAIHEATPKVAVDKDMVAIAERIIAQKVAPFDAGKFEDRYEDALRELIEAKKKGRKIVRPAEDGPSNVVDLMEALRASLNGASSKGPVTGRGGATKKSASPARKVAAKRSSVRRVRK